MEVLSKRIMVVDDEPRNHRIMEDLLEDEYELFLASSGEECLEKIDDVRPDVVLMDIMMPGMDGYQTCEKVTARSNGVGTPVIFVSAKDSLSDRLKGYEAGGIDYFVKPFDHNEIVSKIKTVFRYVDSSKKQSENASSAQKIAMQAMTTSSELGVVVRFFQDSYNATNYGDLTKLIFSTMENFGLKCSLQVRDGEDSLTVSDEGISSPIEATIMEKAEKRNKIFDHGSTTVFSCPHVSILVREMPLDDEVRYGLIKDNICYLLDGAEECVLGLKRQVELDRQRKYLVSIVKAVNSMLKKFNEDLHQLRLNGATIVEDMMDEMNDLVPRLALDEHQENSLFAVTEKGVEETTRLFNNGIRVDTRFQELMEQLANVDFNDNTDSSQLGTLLSNLMK